ncbi:hypothetical protein JCGZ_10951 [Jatropha curcas]|uniref:Uncharacterized protein n=1 Tax=Jatropha curcas TaxID=180498 RepID=A0A067KTE1_JATCU|nr:hypothetical protein JCGZ_10951 [Jatropha curcas]
MWNFQLPMYIFEHPTPNNCKLHNANLNLLSEGGHITVSGTGTIGSNRSRTITGTGIGDFQFDSGSRFLEPKPVVPQNRSKPDWNRRFSGRL